MNSQTDIHTEEVVFASSSAGISLAGSLTLPASDNSGFCILLLSGSGPQDRDESIAGHKPFFVLADHMVDRGHTVFRWDDRGVGSSQGDYLTANAELLVADVMQAVKAVRKKTDIKKIVLLAHSQGCLIGSMCAARFPGEIDALGLLAGAGMPGKDVLLHQHRRICEAEHYDAEITAQSLTIKEQIFDELIRLDNVIRDGAKAETVIAEARAKIKALIFPDLEDAELTREEQREVDACLDDLMEWEWRFLLNKNPADDLMRVSCPVLLMTGTHDTQVSVEEDLPLMRRALRDGGNDKVTVEVLDAHNHLFQRCETGALSEYEAINEVWSPESLAAVTRWLDSLKAR